MRVVLKKSIITLCERNQTDFVFKGMVAYSLTKKNDPENVDDS
jgi:hypothetical protein